MSLFFLDSNNYYYDFLDFYIIKIKVSIIWPLKIVNKINFQSSTGCWSYLNNLTFYIFDAIQTIKYFTKYCRLNSEHFVNIKKYFIVFNVSFCNNNCKK